MRFDSENPKVSLRKVGRTDPKKWEGLTQKSGKNWPKNMRTSDSKNEKVWLRKVETIDPKKWGLTQKLRRSDSEKWKGLIETNGKVGLTLKWESLTHKIRRSDSENWEGLTKKMRRSDLEKWEDLTPKNGKVWF